MTKKELKSQFVKAIGTYENDLVSGIADKCVQITNQQTSSLQKALEERDKEIESLKSSIAESIELLDEVNDLRKKLEKRIEDLNVDIQEKHDLTVSQSSLIESIAGTLEIVPPEKLHLLSQYLDLFDKVMEERGTPMEGREVQDDLIKMSTKSAEALNLYYNYKNKENG